MRPVTVLIVIGGFSLLIWANLRWAYVHQDFRNYEYVSYGWPIPLYLFFVFHGNRPHPGEDYFWLVGVLLNTIIGLALLFCVASLCEIIARWNLRRQLRAKNQKVRQE